MGQYTDKAKEVYGFLETLSKESPGLMKGFMDMHHAAVSDGVLSAKVKELMSIAISITSHCEGCIACHVKGALDAGATKEEIVETIGVAVLMGGGPSTVYGQKTYAAMEEYTQ
jgi:AhpD family alkylhydroperoxidase